MIYTIGNELSRQYNQQTGQLKHGNKCIQTHMETGMPHFEYCYIPR